jgi:uncharacterized protein (TIGR03066 family)
MRTIAITLLAGLIAFSSAISQDEAKKIVGTWQVSKSDDAPQGASITFTDKGKLTISIKAEGKEFNVNGSYELKGKKLLTKIEFNGKEKSDELEITELTDDKLVTKDSKGKIDEFKKVKEKK